MQVKLILFFLVTSIGFSQDTEWTYLFDGKTFDGWHQYNKDKMSDGFFLKLTRFQKLMHHGKQVLKFKFWITKIFVVQILSIT